MRTASIAHSPSARGDACRELPFPVVSSRARNASTAALCSRSPTAFMWSRPGIAKASAPGMRAASASARAAPDRPRCRPPPAPAPECCASSLGRQRLARRGDAGRQRLAVAAGLVGEDAEHAAARVGHLIERTRREAPPRAAPPARTPRFTIPSPSPPSTSAPHALRMRQRQQGGDPRAHRIADHVRLLDAEMVEQPARILRHDRHAVGCGSCGLPLSPWPRLSKAITRRPAATRSRTHEVETQLTRWFEPKPWMRSVGMPVALVDEGDLDAVGIECLKHA